MNPIERAAGLTQPLPEGERVLWQGKPVAAALTRSVFHLKAIGIYCAVIAIVVIAAAVANGRPVGQGIAEVTLMIPFALAGLGLLTLVGRATARATTYTLTNRRVILHIGVAYEMTVSVPLSAITDARLRRGPDGHGEIALAVKDSADTSYIALWPHARFGAFVKPQPMLRGIADVDRVCETLGDALTLFNAGARQLQRVAAPQPAYQTVAA